MLDPIRDNLYRIWMALMLSIIIVGLSWLAYPAMWEVGR